MKYRRTAVLKRNRSGAVAAKRLKFLLAADQTGFPPELLAMLKNDICRIVSRYMEVDASQMELHVRYPDGVSSESRADYPAILCTGIPVRSLRLKGTIT